MTEPEPLTWALEHETLCVVWVQARGISVAPSSPELVATIREAIDEARSAPPDEEARTAIRDLLRGHGYKPSGRGKPASEFLTRAALRDEFPAINNVVDINNLVSLQTGWPISVFDLDRAQAEGAAPLAVRLGHAGEQFVFNAAGQSIDIGGLISVARADGTPIGNPVKDSMATKLDESTTGVLAVLYTSLDLVDAGQAQAVGEHFADLLVNHASAAETRVGILPLELLGETR